MDDSIICRYDWTATEAEKASREHWRLVIRPAIRWLAHTIAFAVSVVCVASLATNGPPVIPSAFLVVIGYWYFVRPLELRWWHRRRFAKRPDAGAAIEWTASEQGLCVHVADLGRSEVSWKAITKCVRVRHGFLIYGTETIWHWLPDAGFESSEHPTRFALLAEQRAIRFESRG